MSRILLTVALAMTSATASQGAFSLDWGNNPWPAGTTSPRTFTDVDGSGVDVTLSFRLTGVGFVSGTPVVSATLNGADPDSNPSLHLQANFTTNRPADSNIVVTVSFSRPVTGLSFVLFDIDRGGTSWRDLVTLSGSPTLTNNPAMNTVSGSAITGDGSAGNDTASGNVGVTYAGPLTMFTITYAPGPGVQSDPASQGIGLSDLSFAPTAAPASVVPTAAAGLLGTGLLGLIRRRRAG